jgi:acyl-CoA thioesterase-1
MSFVPGRGATRYWLQAAFACAAASLLACGAETQPNAAPPSRSQANTADAAPDLRPVVLFVGTSLTAGYGLPSDAAFPALIGQQIADAGLDYRVVNAGVSGDTSAGGLSRIDWLLRAPLSVLVLELGANDMLRGQDPEALRDNLTAIVERARAAHPEVRLLIAGMRAAPNLGIAYARRFEDVYPELAEHFDAALVPFLLVGVAGDAGLNQADGIHPTAEGHRVIADTLWPALRPLL